MSWKSLPLSSCLIDHEVGRANQINTADIQPAGRFPVVDQGQAYIAGYTDDAERVIRDGLPYVIFGDHTRCFKYVDFPFVLGGDGTKVLKPNPQLFDARFFYYAALALDIPNRGYNRHFTLLKEKLILRPRLEEQRRIASVLSVVQRAVDQQKRLIALAAELKNALLHRLFTEGTRGEPRKQPTRFGQAPASWRIVPLGQCCLVQTGIAKGRKVNAEDAIGVPYLRVANVQDGHLDLREIKTITIRKSELSRFSLRPGDVVLTEGGDLDKLGRGFIWNGELPECVHQNHIFAIRPDVSLLSSEFIAYQTQSPYGKQYFLSVAHKTTNLACINTSKLKGFPVLVPTRDEQVEIERILRLLDERRSVAVNTLAAMQSLFRTLLHELMTAQIRVRDLDLSALEEAEPESVVAA